MYSRCLDIRAGQQCLNVATTRQHDIILLLIMLLWQNKIRTSFYPSESNEVLTQIFLAEMWLSTRFSLIGAIFIAWAQLCLIGGTLTRPCLFLSNFARNCVAKLTKVDLHCKNQVLSSYFPFLFFFFLVLAFWIAVSNKQKDDSLKVMVCRVAGGRREPLPVHYPSAPPLCCRTRPPGCLGGGAVLQYLATAPTGLGSS